jgi:hypothetical protein
MEPKMSTRQHYPKWIRTQHGNDLIVYSPEQHAAHVGYPVDETGQRIPNPVTDFETKLANADAMGDIAETDPDPLGLFEGKG